MASGWNLLVWLPCIGVVSGCWCINLLGSIAHICAHLFGPLGSIAHICACLQFTLK